MNERLFLYIDILNFSNLIKDPAMIAKIYKNIDELNVYGHAPYFRAIVFSDTILVYSSEDWSDCKDRSGALMWMCEFAQDLFYRLVGKDIHFRALLTVGEFAHSEMKNINAFYGRALVDTYNYEKNIICTGLFMNRRLVADSNIFKTDPYDSSYHFVHIMQHLNRISFPSGYPLDPYEILATRMEIPHAYDFVYIKNVYRHMTDINLHPHHRAKYQGTWQMLRTRSAALLDAYANSDFDPRAVVNLDWTNAMRRVAKGTGFYG